MTWGFAILLGVPAMEAGQARASDDWRLGVDLSPEWQALMGAGIGGLGALLLPSIEGEIAYELADAWWLWGRVSFAFNSDDTSSATSGGATLGARWIANPDASVRIGWSLALVAAAFETKVGTGGDRVTSRATSILFSAAMSAEMELVKSLTLRLGLDIAEAGYVARTLAASERDEDFSEIAVAVTLRPRVGLGLTF